MKLILEGKLENIFKAKDFVNKDGVVESRGKWQLQFIDKIDGDEGVQLLVHKVSIPDNLVDEYKEKIGQNVIVNVKAFSNKGKVLFYGV